MELGDRILRRWGRKRSAVQTQTIPFGGGTNTETPPLRLPPGLLRNSLNFEPDPTGGYRRTEGFERFDGRNPSDATYLYLLYDNGTADPAFAVDDVVVGVSSGSQGTVLAVSHNDDTDDGYITLFMTTGSAFTDDENLQVGGVTKATANGTGTANGLLGVDESAHRASLLAAIQDRRALINKPGENLGDTYSGGVLGAFILDDKIYAIRQNSTQGEVDILRAGSDGNWTKVALGSKVRFTGGAAKSTALPAEGDTVTGATSGATFTIKRIVVKTGTFEGADAEGYYITDSVTGTLSASENLQISGDTVGVYGSTEAQSISQIGRYHFVKHNFSGHTKTQRIYGCDGANPGFEFDNQDGAGSEIFVQIETGMTTDTPERVAVFNNHLFFAFPGGSLQNSGYQAPLNWDVLLGADERTAGDEIVNMERDKNEALWVSTRDSTWVLYGSSAEDFEFRQFIQEVGSIPYSMQKLGDIYAIDDRGVIMIRASEAYGNFEQAAISQNIKELIEPSERFDPTSSNVYLVASYVTRERNLIKWVWSDGYTLCMGIEGNRPSGFAVLDFGKSFFHIFSGEFGDTFSGAGPYANLAIKYERIFASSEDGYLYELDSGNMWDGDAIPFYLRTNYSHFGTPENYKDFKGMRVEVKNKGYAEFSIGVDYDYGETDGDGKDVTLSAASNNAVWNVAEWGDFIWDSRSHNRAGMNLYGVGYNIAFLLFGENSNLDPFTVTGVTVNYIIRRLNRDFGS